MSKTPRTIRVAAVQSGAEPCAVAENLKQLDERLKQLSEDGVELALLPEFFPTGNPLEERVLKTAIDTVDEVEDWLVQRASELNMVLAGSYVALEGGETYNRFSVFEPNGRQTYRHKHCAPAPEALYYIPAEEGDLTLDTGLGKMGVLMCIEMSEPDLVCADFSDCALVLVAFAIPGGFPIPRKILNRLTSVPEGLAKRNGVPVVLCSMGGPFVSQGSPIVPFKNNCDYAGRSGIYLPSGPVVDPLPPGAVDVLVADIPLGPHVAEPKPDNRIDSGVPWRVSIFDRLRKGRARRLYRKNLKCCLGLTEEPWS